MKCLLIGGPGDGCRVEMLAGKDGVPWDSYNYVVSSGHYHVLSDHNIKPSAKVLSYHAYRRYQLVSAHRQSYWVYVYGDIDPIQALIGGYHVQRD